jgi:hypothetical protein
MKNVVKKALVTLLALIMLISMFSCKKSDENESAEPVDFAAMSDDELKSYAELGEYMHMTLKQGSSPKGEVVWAAVKKNATVKDYPEQQVSYYVSQIKAQYAYYAEEAGISYKEMLREVGATDESIRSEAESMAADDVIYELVRRDAKITLRSDEKSKFFEKYVEKYVEDYGYSREYVVENMTDEIYDSMLYDKTTEFLIAYNYFE